MTQYNVALMVHTCDRYAFLYKGFRIFFEKYWDKSVHCNYYFATEQNDYSLDEFINIKSGKGEWADRLSYLLKEKIKEKYVLYFQEDMWLTAPTNANFFNELFTLTEQNNWQQVKLHSSDVYTVHAGNTFIEGFNIATVDNQQSGFLMSHQVTLWNKEFLLAQLYSGEHPWRNERRGTKRLKKLDPQILQVDYFAENGQTEINLNNNPVLRSGYYTVSVNGILSDSIVPYIKELISNYADEEQVQYGEQLQHNHLHQLTHDGLPKPRKVDIFKRIKNWVKGK